MSNNTALTGAAALLNLIRYGSPTVDADFDVENEELQGFLQSSAYLTTEDIRSTGRVLDGGSTRRERSRIRYLAALFPESYSLHELANRIHYVLDNRHISISEVRDILRGGASDLPIEKIQSIGSGLREGLSYRVISEKVGVAVDSVAAVENFLGIAEQRRLKLVDHACDAVRDGLSVRQFAAVAGVSKSTAHSLINRAKFVLAELGEL